MRNIFCLLLLSLLINISCEKNHDDENPENTRKDFIIAGKTGDDVLYTDINPDWDKYAYGLSPDSINVDVNQDHVADISIRYSTSSSTSGYTVQTSVSAYNGAYFSPEPINLNDEINSLSGWINTTSLLAFTKIDFASSDTSVSGAWISKQDKYLGVQVTEHGRKTYGWIRISIFIHPETIYIQQVVVKDFACQKD